jgi:hypothetical protein
LTSLWRIGKVRSYIQSAKIAEMWSVNLPEIVMLRTRRRKPSEKPILVVRLKLLEMKKPENYFSFDCPMLEISPLIPDSDIDHLDLPPNHMDVIDFVA